MNTNTMNQVPTQSECYATENEIGKLYKKKAIKGRWTHHKDLRSTILAKIAAIIEEKF